MKLLYFLEHSNIFCNKKKIHLFHRAFYLNEELFFRLEFDFKTKIYLVWRHLGLKK